MQATLLGNGQSLRQRQRLRLRLRLKAAAAAVADVRVDQMHSGLCTLTACSCPALRACHNVQTLGATGHSSHSTQYCRVTSPGRLAAVLVDDLQPAATAQNRSFSCPGAPAPAPAPAVLPCRPHQEPV
jgi:hypothetical protein